MLRSIFKSLFDVIETFVFAFGFFLIGYLFLFQTVEVVGASSYPTISTGERIFVEKVSVRFGELYRGNFVIPEAPNNPEVSFIKRIVGLPGEKIDFKNCAVFINNQILPEPYLRPGVCTRGDPVNIPSDSYFLMGDNREYSSDSRNFGPFPRSKIIGRAIFRFWPPNKVGDLN